VAARNLLTPMLPPSIAAEDCMWRCFEGHIVCNACGLKLSRAKREQEGF
jgi:hypothetical protein